MAVKISDLPSASTVDDADVLPIVQGNTTKKVTKSIFIDDVNDVIYNRHFEGSNNQNRDTTETILAAGDISTDDIFIIEYLGFVDSDDIFVVDIANVDLAILGINHYSKTKIFHNGTEWRYWIYWSTHDSNPTILEGSTADLSADGLELTAGYVGTDMEWDFTLSVRRGVQRGTVPSALE